VENSILASIVAATAVTLVLSLIGLLAIGARWRRRGAIRLLTYAALVLLPAHFVADAVWALPRHDLWAGLGLASSGIAAAAVLRRDWNPPAQVFFGCLGVTCMAFTLFAAEFTLSALPPAALPGATVQIALEVFAFVLLLIGTHEVLNVVGRVRWHRRAGPADRGFTPFVSVHVPTHNEPPEVVLETLQALKQLDYPAYEVIVLDNNTVDEALWRPVERHCEELGFRFFHLEDWPGFKAGALNHGLQVADPRTEIVAVVDADFVVESDFLAAMAGHFADPRVGIVQSAQDFRTENLSPYFRRLALSYRAFDEVSMPSRNEGNAVIFAGTMGLIRRQSIVEAGGWAEWCVTEDAELSLRILARGYDGIYVDQAFGHGILPLTFGALKRQRFRWCFGGIQLVRRHWRLLATGRGVAEDGTRLSLSPGQRYEYAAGGLQWFQPLLVLVLSTLVMMGIVSRMLGWQIGFRPLIGLFVAVPSLLLLVGLIKAVWGLRARLSVGWRDVLGLFGIWLALSWAVALGCIQALVRRRTTFLRTPKFRERRSLRQAFQETRVEFLLAIALVAGAVGAATSAQGPDGGLLAVLAAWGALVFGSAPVAAVAAARAEVRSAALRRRRELESMRGRRPVHRRPSSYALAGAATAAFLVVLASSLAVDIAGPVDGRSKALAVPERGVAVGRSEGGPAPSGVSDAGEETVPLPPSSTSDPPASGLGDSGSGARDAGGSTDPEGSGGGDGPGGSEEGGGPVDGGSEEGDGSVGGGAGGPPDGVGAGVAGAGGPPDGVGAGVAGAGGPPDGGGAGGGAGSGGPAAGGAVSGGGPGGAHEETPARSRPA
jgi:cellulose synthase/poly-beta-1,6-N-acetylglucosamine synthase-like glycosyltransferase